MEYLELYWYLFNYETQTSLAQSLALSNLDTWGYARDFGRDVSAFSGSLAKAMERHNRGKTIQTVPPYIYIATSYSHCFKVQTRNKHKKIHGDRVMIQL